MRLWTPIANSFEAYRRRLIVEESVYYEHIWRLFHINESLIVTLASAVATRVLDIWKTDRNKFENEESSILHIQNILTGLDRNDSTKDPKNGCFSGSMNEWINLLNATKNVRLKDSEPDPFINEINQYINEEITEPLSFLDDWGKITSSHSNPTLTGNKLTRLQRIKAINELRNKLAHVPISWRILPKLHSNLRKEILILMTPEYQKYNSPSEDINTTKFHPALCGKIIHKQAYVTGSNFGKEVNKYEKNTNCLLEWQNWQNDEVSLSWNGSPFFYFDEEFKVSLLFRILNLSYDLEDLEGEYYRFAAEIEPVQKIKLDRDQVEPLLPPLPKQPNNIDVDTNCLALRNKAETAFNNRDFKESVKYYGEISQKCGNSYNHVAKSKHGAAMWRLANYSTDSIDERKKQFKNAIALLEQASEHIEIGYKAEAYYQQSKAYLHLSRIDYQNKKQYLEKALEAIRKALTFVFTPKYIGWYEWLEERIDLNEADIENNQEIESEETQPLL